MIIKCLTLKLRTNDTIVNYYMKKKCTKFSKTEVLKEHSRFDIRLSLNKMQIYYVSKLLLINISEPTTQALNYIDLNSAACHL